MGPEETSTPGDFLQPPLFNSNTDKYQYRRNVRLWYQFVFTSAEAGHSKAKGIASNLGICLYARMDAKFKPTIDAALDGDVLKFTNDDGTKLSNTDQIQTINQILDIVAKDSPTDHVRRLVRLNKAVYMCRRKKNEAFHEYVARFRSLANAYLSHANASTNGQDEQNFAMMLIENAGLDLSTYNNIIRDLVAQTRENEFEPTLNIKLSKLRSLEQRTKIMKETVDEMMCHIKNAEEDTSSSPQIGKNIAITINDSMNELINSITSIKIPKDDKKMREKLRFCITLDMAMNALQDINTSTDPIDSSSNHNTPTSEQKTTTPQKLGTMMGDNRSYDDKSRNKFFAQKRKNTKQYSRKYTRDNDHHYHERQGHRREDDRPNRHYDDEDGKSRSVHDRIGNRYDYDDKKRSGEDDSRSRKRVRFNDQDEYENESYRGDPFFRRQVRKRSKRT